MTTTRNIIGLLVMACAIASASAASAQEIDMLCRVEWTKPDGTQVDMMRQYEIDDATGLVDVYDDQGQGWTHALQVNARLDSTRLVLAERTGLYHELNRVTGMMYSITEYQGGGIERKRGICDRASKLTF